MIKLHELVLVGFLALALNGATGYGGTYEFSYTLNTGDTVTGMLTGTEQGNMIMVTNVLSMTFDNTPLNGPFNLYHFQITPTDGILEPGGALASADVTRNNFHFEGGNGALFAIIPQPPDVNYSDGYEAVFLQGLVDVPAAQFRWSITAFLGPEIQTQPPSQIGYWGKSVEFDVRASGAAPLVYQWLKDGTSIGGATNSSLVITNLQFSDAGSYSVVVTNLVGSITSNPAILAVNPAGVSVALYAGVTIDGVTGLTYGIQYTTDLSSTNSWLGATNITLNTPAQLWIDLVPATYPRRYYRVLPGPITIP